MKKTKQKKRSSCEEERVVGRSAKANVCTGADCSDEGASGRNQGGGGGGAHPEEQEGSCQGSLVCSFAFVFAFVPKKKKHTKKKERKKEKIRKSTHTHTVCSDFSLSFAQTSNNSANRQLVRFSEAAGADDEELYFEDEYDLPKSQQQQIIHFVLLSQISV